MITDMNTPEERAEEAPPAAPSRTGPLRGCPPGDFVYDNAQILLELLRGRAAEEERRRFVAGLRRLAGALVTPDGL